MPSNQSFGHEMSGNRRRSGDLSPETRAIVLGKLEEGRKLGKIAAALDISCNTVYYMKNDGPNTAPRLRYVEAAGRRSLRLPSSDILICFFGGALAWPTARFLNPSIYRLTAVRFAAL